LAVPGLACVGYFAFKGAFFPFVDALWSFNRYYGSQASWGVMVSQVAFAWPQLVVEWLPLGFLSLLGAMSSFSASPPPWSRWSLGWLGVSVVGVTMSPWLYRHYFLQLLPPLTALAVAGWDRLRGQRFAYGVWAVTCAVPLWANAVMWQTPPSQIYTMQFLGRSHGFEAELVAHHLKREWTPDTTVAIWGMEPELYVRLQQPAPGEVQSLLAFAAPWYEAREQKWLTGLEEHPPRFLVYVDPPFIRLKNFSRFRELADRHYQLKWRWPHFIIMERKG